MLSILTKVGLGITAVFKASDTARQGAIVSDSEWDYANPSPWTMCYDDVGTWKNQAT